jgi:filamentous hemagglutinin
MRNRLSERQAVQPQEHARLAARKLDPAKQGKHSPSSGNYIPGPNMLTDPDPEGLLDQWGGTGRPVNEVPIVQRESKECVEFGKVIGHYVSPLTGEAVPTSNGIIAYDRRGNAHIIPARP